MGQTQLLNDFILCIDYRYECTYEIIFLHFQIKQPLAQVVARLTRVRHEGNGDDGDVVVQVLWVVVLMHVDLRRRHAHAAREQRRGGQHAREAHTLRDNTHLPYNRKPLHKDKTCNLQAW